MHEFLMGRYKDALAEKPFAYIRSEIDHKLRYPYNLSNDMIGSYLEIMNRAAGMADEMGTFLHAYSKEFENAMREGITDDNEVYSYILEQIEKCDDNEVKMNIMNKIKKTQKYKELISVPEMLRDILKNI